MFTSNTTTTTATHCNLGLRLATSKLLLTVTLALVTPGYVQAQASSFAELEALQNTTNTAPGPHGVPAKILPVPDDVSSGSAGTHR